MNNDTATNENYVLMQEFVKQKTCASNLKPKCIKV